MLLFCIQLRLTTAILTVLYWWRGPSWSW